MKRPSEPHVRWKFEWRDDGNRFHVWDFYVSEGFRGDGHGSRCLVNIVEYACRETDATCFSIQMGGGAASARWLKDVSGGFLEFFLRVEYVQGYAGDAWMDDDGERVDGQEDMEGDEQSSVYAVTNELEGLRELKGWD